MSKLESVPSSPSARSFMATVVERTIYHATCNSDCTEGRGTTVDRGYYVDPSLAHRMKGDDYYGKVESELGFTVEINGKVYRLGEEIVMQDPQVTHDNAVAKLRAAGLSPEEARSLNIEF